MMKEINNNVNIPESPHLFGYSRFSQFIKKYPKALSILISNKDKPLKDIASILFINDIRNKGTMYSLSTISILISYIKEINVSSPPDK